MDIVYARATSHVSSPTGYTVLVILGTHWPANDPIVQAYPDMFTTDPAYGLYFSQPPVVAAPPVETAIANPGEKRIPKPDAK